MKHLDAYIQRQDTRVQKILENIRRTVRAAAPNTRETMSYRIPTFDLHGKHLVHFAAFKKHISFFPTSSGIAAFEKSLSKYETSRGTVQFALDKPIPYGLIKRMTVFRVKEVTKQIDKRTCKKAGIRARRRSR